MKSEGGQLVSLLLMVKLKEAWVPAATEMLVGETETLNGAVLQFGVGVMGAEIGVGVTGEEMGLEDDAR